MGLKKGQTNSSSFKKGHVHSEKTRRKISKSLTGQKLSAGTKEKISIAETGEKNHFYRKTHSEESKEMMRQSKLGKKNVLYGKHR